MSDGDLDVYEKVCKSQFNNLDKKLTRIEQKIDKRLEPLEDMQSKLTGIAVVLGIVIPLAVEYLLKLS